jgi:hypothetical protein
MDLGAQQEPPVANGNVFSIERAQTKTRIAAFSAGFFGRQGGEPGWEGRIRLYPGLDGMRRWAGLRVIADILIQMGCYLARPST